jgi:DNA invertase Pin-like site-specific DNA recombinase
MVKYTKKTTNVKTVAITPSITSVAQANQIKHNAIIYCRVSTKNQTNGTSLNSQEYYCKQYCSDNNLTITNIVHEICSAKTTDKQKKLLDIIDTYNNINLVFFEPTRFSRNVCDFTNLLNKCSVNNIIIHSVTGNMNTSNNNDTKNILSNVFDGEIEINTLSRRIKKSIEYRKTHKTYISTIARYGYCHKTTRVNNRMQKIIARNEDEQNIIALINKLYYGSDIKSVHKLLFKITKVNHTIIDYKANGDEVDFINYGNMKYIDIANFLNLNNILKRNKQWQSSSISNLLNQTDQITNLTSSLNINQ